MAKEFMLPDANLTDSLYGHMEDLLRVARNNLLNEPAKQIYNFLLHDTIFRNGSFIPSRNEKRLMGVMWSLARKNLSHLKG